MDNLLIALVIAAVAALSNWLQHRAQSSQEPPRKPDGQPPPRPTIHPVPRRTGLPPVPGPAAESVLERELRRLLGGETPLPPTAPRQPPPVSRQQHPPVVHPVAPRPKVAPMQTRPIAPPPLPSIPPIADRFGKSSTAYQRAQHLQESVAEHMRQVDRHTDNFWFTRTNQPSRRLRRAPPRFGNWRGIRRHCVRLSSLPWYSVLQKRTQIRGGIHYLGRPTHWINP